MQFFATYVAVAAIAAGPVLAQDDSLLLACSETAIGSNECNAEELAAYLGKMTGGDIMDFRESRMESFAILTALRLSASAIFFKLDDDGCTAEEERSQAAEIWQTWVQLPPDATPSAAEKFAVLNGLMNNIYEMEIEC